jgi:chorismate synthase
MLRWLTAGESHGPALSAILEGMPAGVSITSTDISDGLARRRLGFGFYGGQNRLIIKVPPSSPARLFACFRVN